MATGYGGDEISAIVLDIGTNSIRCGYAGEDIPKVVIPSVFGTQEEEGGKKKYFIGDDGVMIWRPNVKVSNPLREGMVHDWECIPAMIKHCICDRLRTDPADHPVLFTEPAWNNKRNREKLAEILFETYNVPATFVTNTAVTNAFAAGKGTALVVDIGQDSSSVVPVIDGYAMTKGIRRQPVCPSLLTNVAFMNLHKPSTDRPSGISLLPYQLIKSKVRGPANADPQYVVNEMRQRNTDGSWLNQMERRVVEDWWEAVGGIMEHPYTESTAINRGSRQHEFPTGYSGIFHGTERLLPGEIFFNINVLNQVRGLNAPPAAEHDKANGSLIPLSQAVPLQNLIFNSVESQDVDVRGQLMQNIVLTGGGSLIPGFAERLTNELGHMSHGQQRIKLHSPGHQYERKFGSWIGGSILASLGTFHQLWISKEEWQEYGPDVLAQRCK